MAIEKRYSISVDGSIQSAPNAVDAEAMYAQIVKDQAFKDRAEFLETRVLGAVERGVVTVARPRKARKSPVKKGNGKKS